MQFALRKHVAVGTLTALRLLSMRIERAMAKLMISPFEQEEQGHMMKKRSGNGQTVSLEEPAMKRRLTRA